MNLAKCVQAVDEQGVAVLQDVITSEQVEHLRQRIDEAQRESNSATIQRRGDVVAIRDLLRALPDLRDVVIGSAIREIASAVLGENAGLVRAVLFDKSTHANWGVFWHQDLTVAVRERVDVPGFTGWSVRSGVTQVQPPSEVLETMLTIRAHLDDCGKANGPLRAISGSHRTGRLSEQEIASWANETRVIDCHLPAGGAVVMRPLLLHSSPKAQVDSRRRVVHLEFATAPLPAPLEWLHWIPLS